MSEDTIKVSVAYAKAARQVWIKLDVPVGTTAEQAIDLSGIPTRFPEIDLTTQKIGIFGRACKLMKVLEAGDRVEIYRPITADPDMVEQRDM